LGVNGRICWLRRTRAHDLRPEYGLAGVEMLPGSQPTGNCTSDPYSPANRDRADRAAHPLPPRKGAPPPGFVTESNGAGHPPSTRLGPPMTQASDYRVVADTTVMLGNLRRPGPWKHAARPNDQETLCGAAVAGMYRLMRHTFAEVHPVMRCRDCSLVFGLLDEDS